MPHVPVFTPNRLAEIRHASPQSMPAQRVSGRISPSLYARTEHSEGTSSWTQRTRRMRMPSRRSGMIPTPRCAIGISASWWRAVRGDARRDDGLRRHWLGAISAHELRAGARFCRADAGDSRSPFLAACRPSRRSLQPPAYRRLLADAAPLRLALAGGALVDTGRAAAGLWRAFPHRRRRRLQQSRRLDADPADRAAGDVREGDDLEQ